MQLLRQWVVNPLATQDSSAALVFQTWYLELADTVFAETLGDLWPRVLRRSYLLNQALDQLVLDDGASVWWQDDKAGLLAAALDQAVTTLSKRLGADTGKLAASTGYSTSSWGTS